MPDVATLAAANNARLCDAIVRTHGCATRFDHDAWTSPGRTPPLYPDAVALQPDVVADDLLARIDNGPGASIKDSFATLDLASHGYRVLFDARWLSARLEDHAGDGTGWSVVESAYDFVQWEAAWRGDSEPSGVLLPSILETDLLVAVCRRRADPIAGAIFNRSAGVVGVSNFFATEDAAGMQLRMLAFAEARFGALTLVAYESGADLNRSLGAGFRDEGPLRVWVR
jgi:hypothetical protein